MSVDGTDCMIPEQTPWTKKWWSHKFNGPGVRYEIAIAIRTGLIVWINGPFPCGSYPDVNIFERDLLGMLGKYERVEADKGYSKFDPTHAKTPAFSRGKKQEEIQNRVRARQETINKRLKQWGVLKHRFRNHLDHHHLVFGAVAIITQLSILSGEPLFHIPDYVD